MRCKPGDLAFVVRDGRDPENIGTLVRVVLRPPSEIFRAPDGWRWFVDPNAWLVQAVARPIIDDGDRLRYAVYRDTSLSPLPRTPETAPAPPQAVTA